MSKKTRVCILVPAYNEGAVIYDVITNARKAFSSSRYNYTFVVINDGSSDITSSEAKRAGAVVINHILNSGAGGATSTGIRYAYKNKFVAAATMDADGQHSAYDVLRGFDELFQTKSDFLIGSRLIDSAGMSKVKVLGNWGLSVITRLLFGVKSTDSQSGLRIFSQHALQSLRWQSTGYEFCSEMLWRASQLGLKMGEYPIKAIYTDYSVSKGQSNWNAINIIKNLLRRRISEIFG